jgi:hypothetical protein
VDVSFVAPLPKCHFFHVLSHAPLFTDFTNGGFVVGRHRPIPSASPKPGHCDKVFAIHPQRLIAIVSVVIELDQRQTAPEAAMAAFAKSWRRE